MAGQYLNRILQDRGYCRETNAESYVFVRRSGNECYVVMPVRGSISAEDIMRRRQQLAQYYHTQGIGYVYHLCIVIEKDAMFSPELLRMVDIVPNLWIYTDDQKRFWQYEHQPGEFDGLNAALEANRNRYRQDTWTYMMQTAPWITILLIAVNVFCFLYPILTGKYDVWLEKGMDSRHYVFEMHQYYRLFTSMFLHGGIEHLFNNMLVLLVLGINLEPVLGKLRYTVIYIASGIFGAILSCLFTNGMTGSVGASGAIFGLSGAMLALVLFYRKQVPQLSLRRVIFMCVSSLYGGFTSISVDNAAHMGGLISGFILVIITNKVHKKCT